MKYYLIAGEASGDLHGSNLIRELKLKDPAAELRCWGGDKMEAAGAELVKHFRELAFMGFWEVLKNLRTILRNLAFCKEDILRYQPDAIILIDYPGFNLRIAEWAKQQGIKVIYYISPQVWAWKENRVKKMKRDIDLMIVILPFEKTFFEEKWKWSVHYVGHPLVEVIDQQRQLPLPAPTTDKPIVAVLPGSRKQEIEKKLPVMLEMSKCFAQYQFVLAQAPGLEPSYYAPFLEKYPNVSIATEGTYTLLRQARAAMVTSGTATLETALMGVPEVVCYKGSPISYAIAKRVIRVKYISLVNLIMDRLLVKELIQHELNPQNLEKELRSLLEDEERRNQLAADYLQLRQLLGQPGNASARAAALIHQFVSGAA